MSSNETDTPRDPALRRAEAAGDAVAEAIEGYVDRLPAGAGAVHTERDAALRAAGRLMARNTQRQLAANLTLVRRLMEARSLPAMLKLQQDYLRRQAEWALRDWQRAGAQALDLLAEGRRPAAGKPAPADPEPVPARGPESDPSDAGGRDTAPSRSGMP